MKLTLNIPEKLSEITLSQYQQWLKIAEGKELDQFLQQKMIEIFCKIPLKKVLSIKATDIDSITATIGNLFTQDAKLIDRFELNGKEFGFIPDLDKITFGACIDLDRYVADWQLMHKAMSVLFRPITLKKKNKYLIEKYKSAEKYNLRAMTLDIAFGALVFFWNLRSECQSHILSYLATQTEVELPPALRASLKSMDGTAPYIPLHKEMLEELKTLQN